MSYLQNLFALGPSSILLCLCFDVVSEIIRIFTSAEDECISYITLSNKDSVIQCWPCAKLDLNLVLLIFHD